jgi:hypothetical protein
MAYGDTQNFSMPIYSGQFVIKVTFFKPTNPVSHPSILFGLISEL